MLKRLSVAVAAIVLLAGCTDTPEPTESTSPPATSSSPIATSSAPEPASPSPSPTQAAPWAAPADWNAIPPEDAGVDADSVNEVIGAWRLPGGAVASIVTVKNSANTTDPAAYYKATFGDFETSEDVHVTHEARATDAGEPVLLVTAVPDDSIGGDAQQFVVVLGPSSVTWATISDSPESIADSGDDLWELLRRLPA